MWISDPITTVHDGHKLPKAAAATRDCCAAWKWFTESSRGSSVVPGNRPYSVRFTKKLMAATSRAILGQIIKLAKSIALQEPIGKKGFKTEFVARIPRLELIGIGPTVTLWKTEGSFEAIKSIARMIRFCHPEAVDCDSKTIEGLTMKIIEDLILDESIFRPDRILMSSQRCLVDCRVDQDINEFANKIYSQLMSQLRTSINDWCNVIGVPRVKCDSLDIPQAHISLISRMDTKRWEEVVSKNTRQVNGLIY